MTGATDVSVPTIRRCKHCKNVVHEYQVATSVPGTTPVNVAMCKICDVRLCKPEDGHYVTDPRARRCPECNVTL